MRILLTLLLLAVTWLLWSGVWQPLQLTAGALSCLLAIWLSWRMGFFSRGLFSLHVSPGLPRFWAWLLVEIVKSNLQVVRVVLNPRRRLSPSVVEIRTTTGPVGQTLLGNAITLTPGTVTIDVHQGRLRVHCLTQEAAEELQAGQMDARVRRVTMD